MLRWAIIIVLCFGFAFAILNVVMPPPSVQRRPENAPDFSEPHQTPSKNALDVSSQTHPTSESTRKDPEIIDWRLLRDLDLKTGKRSADLEKINGRLIAIPGFMVPFEDSMGEASEFLLVPSPQACIHVPPPPANQMIYVKMKEKPAKMQWVPIWLNGKFHIQQNDSPYGNVSFYVEGFSTKPFGG